MEVVFAAAMILFLEKSALGSWFTVFIEYENSSIRGVSHLGRQDFLKKKNLWVILSCKSNGTNVSFQESKYQTGAF